MRRNPELDHKIGAALRALRKRRSLSDAEVAGRMGYGANGKHYVNRWERGDRGITAALLWRYLQTSVPCPNEYQRHTHRRAAWRKNDSDEEGTHQDGGLSSSGRAQGAQVGRR